MGLMLCFVDLQRALNLEEYEIAQQLRNKFTEVRPYIFHPRGLYNKFLDSFLSLAINLLMKLLVWQNLLLFTHCMQQFFMYCNPLKKLYRLLQRVFFIEPLC